MAHTPPGKTRERVLAWMRDRLLAGRSPSLREVQEQFGFRSVESARSHLEALVRDRRLAKTPGQARGYRLPGVAPSAGERREGVHPVPLLGRVAAGSLTWAAEDREGVLWVDGLGPTTASGTFALRVRGASMRDAGILDGDIVVVHAQGAVRSGDIVVARVGDEATVKTLRRRKGQVILEPANPAFSSIILDPTDEMAILGKVIQVRRWLDGVVPVMDLPGDS